MKTICLLIYLFFLNICFGNNPFQTSKNNPFTNKEDFSIWGIFFDFSILNPNLKNLNNTLPVNASKLNPQNYAMGFGILLANNNISYISEGQFGFKQRILVNDYEQFSYHVGRWGNLIGLTFSNKKKNLFLYPQIGISLDWQEIHYINDSIDKSTSINWIEKGARDPGSMTDIYYSNPGFSIISNLRFTKILKKFIGISGFISYQKDLSNGKWQYDYHFINRKSPNTYSTGFTFGLSIGAFISDNIFY